MIDLTVKEILDGLATRQFSSRELVATCLERIGKLDPVLNAFVTVTAESALAAADAADQARQNGDTSPLLGLPLAHKDVFCTEGVRSSAGSKMLDNFVSPYDATVVARLRSAGAISLGKLNMDEFAMGSSNENSFYGPVKNPWNTEHVPGGSSGGSAAAVAARLVPVATGTDTGGSVRQPAAFCGITGVKPTYGRVSRWGMIAYASSLDQAGVLAPSAMDAAAILEQMWGFDERDSTSLAVATQPLTTQLSGDIKGLRVGLCTEYFQEGLGSGSRELIMGAVEMLRQAGATVREISLPNVKYSVPAYYVIAPAECSANLSRFDGVRFGHRCDSPQDIDDLYRRSRTEGFGAEVQQRVMVGAFALSTGYYDAYYRKAQQVRRLIRDDFVNAFNDVDVLIGPVSPTPAFRLGEKTSDPVEMYLQDIYTIAPSLAGLPALSIPVGFDGGLPVGMQVIGNYMLEAPMLNVAHAYQQVTDWHKSRPAMAEEA